MQHRAGMLVIVVVRRENDFARFLSHRRHRTRPTDICPWYWCLLDVCLNGKVVLKGLDVFKEAGGPNKPLVREFKGVEVTGGKLVIGFTADVQNPEINGIEILAE